MIKSIEFREGVLALAISSPVASGSGQRQGSVEFDFGERGAVSEFHRSELMNFLYSIDAEGPHKIADMVFELLRTQARVCRIDFYRFNSRGEPLEASAAPDVGIQFASGALQGAGGEEDIPF